MERFIKGDVVVLPFPFSDLSASKKRPALVLADLPNDDIILCQITSRDRYDSLSVPITDGDFVEGSLPVASNIRPCKIFTADKNIIIRKAGTINDSAIEKTTKIIIDLLQ